MTISNRTTATPEAVPRPSLASHCGVFCHRFDCTKLEGHPCSTHFHFSFAWITIHPKETLIMGCKQLASKNLNNILTGHHVYLKGWVIMFHYNHYIIKPEEQIYSENWILLHFHTFFSFNCSSDSQSWQFHLVCVQGSTQFVKSIGRVIKWIYK